jgi:hypothetical protein
MRPLIFFIFCDFWAGFVAPGDVVSGAKLVRLLDVTSLPHLKVLVAAARIQLSSLELLDMREVACKTRVIYPWFVALLSQSRLCPAPIDPAGLDRTGVPAAARRDLRSGG